MAILLKNEAVIVEQTEHEFLFGVNRNREMLKIIYAQKYPDLYSQSWGRPFYLSSRLLDNYVERFLEIANYTQLVFNWNIYEPEKGKN